MPGLKCRAASGSPPSLAAFRAGGGGPRVADAAAAGALSPLFPACSISSSARSGAARRRLARRRSGVGRASSPHRPGGWGSPPPKLDAGLPIRYRCGLPNPAPSNVAWSISGMEARMLFATGFCTSCDWEFLPWAKSMAFVFCRVRGLRPLAACRSDNPFSLQTDPLSFRLAVLQHWLRLAFASLIRKRIGEGGRKTKPAEWRFSLPKRMLTSFTCGRSHASWPSGRTS